MSAPELDYYQLLEVARTATDEQIRVAYRRLARFHHPDANPAPEAEGRMRRINEAWETLRDPARRQEYDRRSARASARPLRRPPPARRAPSRPAATQRANWFQEDSPREETRPGGEFTGDPTIDWYALIGVRSDSSRPQILKALSRMAAELNGADVSATEFTRRAGVMRQAWAILGDQHLRAAYDRARRASPPPIAEEDLAESAAPPPPAGYREGPLPVNGYQVARSADLRGADLRGADLRGIDLAGIDLREAKLQGVDFEAASLRRAKLSGADLSGANLRFSDLSNADCAGATLRQADLTRSALHATSFHRANLGGARLAGAVGPGVNLDYADLSRADFTGANITPQLIERGRLAATIMPDGSTAGEPSR